MFEKAMTSLDKPQSVSSTPHTPVFSRRVVIVEDNNDSRESLRMLLEAWDYQVEVAADGLQGVKKILALRPAAAVVDIGLPGLDGYQVARQVRSVLENEILLIALTGYGQAEDRKRALTAGFDVHMKKPADLDQLFRLLAE